ncbi:lipoyl(octanoyl) transferase LipB [Oscillatoria sp. CS-180]|uniref:lipoyl(octanoyl) transferase LipB n=1 Tax=Oscillatoria sp. CS-180 TaxID=3021720 RepID=UPI00232ADCB1|nr:lipoyl(octanoyl) transferase LipB [Oscillatoria sp. CS-180]MDB9525540.1 lipoyl(octanoyl) transferase LipB [Oscillatoria sp. CS-180]
MAKRICWLYRLETVSYDIVWRWQQNLLHLRRQNPDLPDALLLVEHPPVYTLGQGADESFLKFTPNAHMPPVVRIERGGEVTYHCPGQLVGYPILNLRRHRPDLHWYLRQLEEVVIRTVSAFEIDGERSDGLTGVWVEGRKVAAIGIKASRWITMHGFALNICPDLSGFQHIVPCGIADKAVGSLSEFQQGLDRLQVQPVLEKQFAQVFQCELVPQDLCTLPSSLS